MKARRATERAGGEEVEVEEAVWSSEVVREKRRDQGDRRRLRAARKASRSERVGAISTESVLSWVMRTPGPEGWGTGEMYGVRRAERERFEDSGRRVREMQQSGRRT